MTEVPGLRTALLDGVAAVGARARARRWETFTELFGDLSGRTVVDLGGTPGAWLAAPVRPRSVVVLNLDPQELAGDHPEWLTCVRGDACDPPSEITNRTFDVAYSNSVMEHVGGVHRRRAMAEVVHRLAPAHWVQVPYRYTPIEPHFVFPGFQFLPLRAQVSVVMRWPMLPHRSATVEEAVRRALGTELLSRTEMRSLFPDSELEMERVAGAPKSLVAVRRPSGCGRAGS